MKRKQNVQRAKKIMATHSLAQMYLKMAQYLDKKDNILKEIKAVYPQANLNSPQDSLEYLKEVLPAFIYRYIVFSNSLKSCSSISPAFAEQACMDGFATTIVEIPGHYQNMILCDGDFNIGVDLSAIQFKMCEVIKTLDNDDNYDDNDPFNERRAQNILMREVIDNPFQAARVWKSIETEGVPPTGYNVMGPVEPININHWEKIWQKEHPNYKQKEDYTALYQEHPLFPGAERVKLE